MSVLDFLPRCDRVESERPSFVVRIDLVGGRVALSGELGRRTAHLLHDAVSTLMQTGGEVWVLDVTELTGCDGIGLRTIGSVYRRALRHGRRLAVVGAPRSLEAKLIRLRLNGHVLACDHSAPAADDRRLA